MPRAVLQIDADTSGLLAAFAAVRGAAKAAEADVKASMGNAVRASTAGYQRTGRVARDEAARTARADEQGAQRSLAAFVRSEDQKRRALAMTAASRRRAETDATKFAQDEARKRGLTGEQEARVRQGALERFTRQYESAEKRQTTIAQREQAARSRQGRDIGYGLRRGLNVGRDAALNVAREAHVQIQDARQRRAASEHTLNAAFFQAGIGGNEASAMRDRLQTEVATGGLRGLSMDQVSAALMDAQTQSSVLSGASPAERASRFNDQIGLMRFARATYQDPAEVLRAGGMLSKQGITGAAQMDVLRNMTGMAQAGSIELSTVMSTALGPMMANIARSTSAGQTPEARAASVRSAVLETMAVGELTSAGGLTPRHALNALAALRTEVTSPVMAGRVRQRLIGEGRTELADRLTAQDSQGRVTLRNQSAVGFVSDLMQGMGGDTNAVTNLLRSGGSRSAMVLGSPVRTLISALASQGSGGRTIGENVARMQAEGSTFNAADEARGAALVEGEQQTALQSAEETGLNALTNNTSAVVSLSQQFADWAKRNPMESTTLKSVGGLVSGVIGGAVLPRIGAWLAGTAAGSFLTGTAAQGAAGAAAGGGAAASLTPPALLASFLSFGGAFGGVEQSDVGRQQREGAEWERQSGRLSAQARAAGTAPPTAAEIGLAVAAALAQQPITATVAPVDAAHASSQAPAAGAPAR